MKNHRLEMSSSVAEPVTPRNMSLLWLKAVITLILLFAGINESYAATTCSQSTDEGGSGQPAYGTFYGPNNISITSANKSVGTVLWQQTVITSPLSTVECTSSDMVSEEFVPLTGVSTGQTYKSNFSIYTTTVKGVGFTVGYNPTGTTQFGHYSFPYYSSSSGVGTRTWNNSANQNDSGDMALIVTGPVTSGVIPAGNYAQFNFGNVPLIYWKLANDVIVNSSGCEITGNSNIFVRLGTISNGKFPNIGSVNNNTPFNIPLSCNPGTRVGITITALTDPDSEGTISNTGTAKGVGVQILSSTGTPVSFGKSFNVIPSAESTDEIDFSAQIIREGKITAGTVNASATYTLNYQ